MHLFLSQVFEINPWRAWGAVATTVASVSLSIYLLAVSPWYLLPLVYAFAGTAWTGVSPSSCVHAYDGILVLAWLMLMLDWGCVPHGIRSSCCCCSLPWAVVGTLSNPSHVPKQCP